MIRNLTSSRGYAPTGGLIDTPWAPGDTLTARRLEAMRKELADLKRQLGARDMTYNPIGRGGGTSLTLVRIKTTPTGGATTFVANFIDSAGAALPETGENGVPAITVQVAAPNQPSTGVYEISTNVALAAQMPWLKAGQYVNVENRAVGTFRPGWWLVGSTPSGC